MGVYIEDRVREMKIIRNNMFKDQASDLKSTLI